MGELDGAMSYEHLLFDRSGPVTTITLNRPERHNALDRATSAELHEAIRAVHADRDCRVLVLRGNGDTFCAGDDIKEFNEWPHDEGYWQVRKYQQTAQLIEDLTPVTVALVDGVCTGGGLELTLVCDFVIATDRSRWGMPEIDWDITPGWGGTSRLVRYAGRRKAKEWNLIGALFSGAVAERYDLVNRLCAPEELERELDALVEVILSKDPVCLRRTKHFMDKGADVHISAALAFEAEPTPRPFGHGIVDFTEKEARERRRALSKYFWQDDAGAR